MQSTQLIVGAAVAMLGGALSGATINTKPLPRGIDAWDHIPRHELTAAELEVTARNRSLPDHYPLITPQGRIEVAELRDHGLYRNRRFGTTVEWYEPDEEPSYEVVAAEYRYVPDDYSDHPAPPLRSAAPSNDPIELPAHTELRAPEAPAAPTVRPRVIDVAAALDSD